MILKKIKQHSPVLALMGLLIFLAVFYSFYLFDYPGFTGDSVKFQYIGKVLGICHPTGYPLFIAISHLFSHIPIQTLAFRANLQSMVFALIALGLLYGLIYRATGRIGLSLALAVFAGGTNAVWTYACAAEVYSLHLALLMGIAWAVYSWDRNPSDTRLCWVFILLTLGFLHHLLTVTLLPALAYLLWARRKEIHFDPLFRVGIVLSIGLFIGTHGLWYSHIQSSPYYMDYPIPDVPSYLHYILGGTFQQNFVNNTAGLHIFMGIVDLMFDLVKEWGPFFLVFIVACGYFLWKGSHFARFIAIVFAVWAGLCSQYDIPDIDQYYSQGALLGCLLAGLLVGGKAREGKPKIGLEIGNGFLIALALATGLYFLCNPPRELRDYQASNPHGMEDVLRQAPNNAVIVCRYYGSEQLLRYYAVVNEDWSKDILYMVTPNDVRDYLQGKKPLRSREHVIKPGREIYAFSYFDWFTQAGLQLNPLPIPPNTAMAETLSDRIEAWPRPMFAAVVSNNAGGYALTPKAIKALRKLGLKQTLDPKKQYQLTGIASLGEEKVAGKFVVSPNIAMTGMVKNQRLGGLKSPIKIRCISQKQNDREISLIDVGKKRYVPNRFGLSFVLIHPKTGQVKSTLTVDTSESMRVYPYAMARVTLPGVE
ncbi:DUF2723 domain-containing protein [bacterium]|nr:DUF2723 domain-containing protein [bacterium]